MAPKMTAAGAGRMKTADKLTDSEKKKLKQANKAKANPEKAAKKKEETDRKKDKRKESGSVKTYT